MRVLKWVGTALLFFAIAICFAPTVVPPFLDRIYYEGPASDHFRNGRFFNPRETGFRYGAPFRFFNRWATGERAQWPEHVPVTQTEPPPRVDGDEMRVTWVGHATVLIQTQGLNILTDPIWSQRASPFSFMGPRRVRAPGVAFSRLPKIDLVLISHNHYDHLDLATLKRLWDRDRPLIVTSLGNDTILANAGIPKRGLHKRVGVVAQDWDEEVPVFECKSIEPGSEMGLEDCSTPFAVYVTRNHHWSSRWGTDRNRALWSAFVVQVGGDRIFYAGDTGFGDGSWVREAAARGPFRLAIIPIGAYEPRDFMKTNHVNPEEAMRIFEALDPVRALGIHWGTFQLTFEPIDEPRQRLEALKRQRGLRPDRFVAVEAGQGFIVPSL
jgi:L-ascorbate metabolism protein UlaG (beta-lactamase superfamily)